MSENMLKLNYTPKIKSKGDENMQICTGCNNQFEDHAMFCPQCGKQAQQSLDLQEKAKDQKVTTGYFFGMNFVYSIPIIGIVVAIAIIVSKQQKQTQINYAKAMLIWNVIEIILTVVTVGIVAAFGAVVSNVFDDERFYREKYNYEQRIPMDDYFRAEEFFDEVF